MSSTDSEQGGTIKSDYCICSPSEHAVRCTNGGNVQYVEGTGKCEGSETKLLISSLSRSGVNLRPIYGCGRALALHRADLRFDEITKRTESKQKARYMHRAVDLTDQCSKLNMLTASMQPQSCTAGTWKTCCDEIVE